MHRNRLHNLLAANRGRGQFRAVTDAAEPTLYLYDVIVSDDYWGGVSDKTFVAALNAIDAPIIHLRINSPGGDVFAARAIEQAIREHSSQIIVHIDGLAASAASYVAVAGDQKLIAPGGFIMIHKAMTVAWGNSADLLSTADLLDKIDGTLIDTYAAATGQSTEDIAAWIAAETWFTAQEAVDLGFADEIADGTDKTASDSATQSAWDLSAYNHAPAEPVAGPPEPTPEPTPEPEPDPATDPEPAPEPAYTQAHTDHLRRKLQLVTQTA